MERSNAAWLAALRQTGAEREAALAELRAILVRGLLTALADDVAQDLESLVEDFAQTALMKILENLDAFRGESQFTTWAHKISVHVAYTELRRVRWHDVSLQDLMERSAAPASRPAVLADPTPSPEQQAMQRSLLATVERLIGEELTERQRQAMLAVMVGGMPMDEVARRLGTNRNALYKLLHDARRRLQQRLQAEGLSIQELLAAFENP